MEPQFQFDLNEIPPEFEAAPENVQETNEQQQSNATSHHKRCRLDSEDEFQILGWLLNRAKEEKLQYGSITAASIEFNVTSRCISKIWNNASKVAEVVARFSVATKLHFYGRKRTEVSNNEIMQLGMGHKTYIRDLSSMLVVSKSTIHRMIIRGVIRD